MLKTKHLKISLLLCGMFFILSSCGKNADNRVVAKVGGEKITLKDVASRIKSLPFGYQEYLATESGQKQFVDIIVRQKIILAAARKGNVHKRKEVAQALKDFRQEYESKIKQYEEELIIETYLKEIESSMNVTDDDVQKYYLSHKRDFLQPSEVKLSHILLSTKEDALKAVKQLKSGKDFEDLAKEISLDPATSKQGGDLGAFKSAELLPDFVEPVKKLNVGAVTEEPVSTNYGFHILKKTSQKILPAQSFEQAKEEIRRLLLKTNFDKWIEEQKKGLKVKVDYSALNTAVK
ncbi:MAG: hypothetical protein A2252_09330 [Elusimicrobia bacterium RIFOXYA2_FULL_39_19]|nr:MAG: hypothetical protein A2252_09330 [Elusimicrobia bacterium RIFOXYA2_FULL_39_19]